jgi:hypothetical protein
MIKVAVIGLVLGLVVVLWVSALMPGVFGSLTPSQQIAIYGFRMRFVPFPNERARSAIAARGKVAADAIAEDLVRSHPKLLPSESAYILVRIQHRGTTLRNSSAEKALAAFIASDRATKADITAGQFALEAIAKDVRLPPELQPR